MLRNFRAMFESAFATAAQAEHTVVESSCAAALHLPLPWPKWARVMSLSVVAGAVVWLASALAAAQDRATHTDVVVITGTVAWLVAALLLSRERSPLAQSPKQHRGDRYPDVNERTHSEHGSQ